MALFILFLVGLMMVPAALFVRHRHRIARPGVGPSPWVYAVAALPAFLFFLMLASGPDSVYPVMFFLVLGSIALCFYVWIREIVNVMGLSDDAFPGRNDKILWLALIVLLPPVGVTAFCIFRRAYWPVGKPVVDSVTRELA